jgi:hypothetical protein
VALSEAAGDGLSKEDAGKIAAGALARVFGGGVSGALKNKGF